MKALSPKDLKKYVEKARGQALQKIVETANKRLSEAVLTGASRIRVDDICTPAVTVDLLKKEFEKQGWVTRTETEGEGVSLNFSFI